MTMRKQSSADRRARAGPAAAAARRVRSCGGRGARGGGAAVVAAVVRLGGVAGLVAGGQLEDHVEGLPPLVSHQTHRALVHNLVQDHQVVVLQLAVRS